MSEIKLLRRICKGSSWMFKTL